MYLFFSQHGQIGDVIDIQFLHDLRRIRARGGPQQQMKMFRHQDVANDSETQLRPQVGERGDEMAFEAFGVENAGAAIGAGGQIVKVILSVISAQLWHSDILTPPASLTQTFKI